MEKLRFPLKTPLTLHPNKPKSHKIQCVPDSSSQIPNIPKQEPSSNALSLLWSIPEWADAIQERGMRRNRLLYTPQDWRSHRSSRRHLRHFLTSLSSRVILSLAPPVLSFTSFAALLSIYNSAVLSHSLPDFLPLLRASPLPYQLTAPALALLLVFRTEASYARFVEGRNCWMRVVAGAGEMAGMVMGVDDDDKDSGHRIKKAVLGYVMAFPVALKVWFLVV